MTDLNDFDGDNDSGPKHAPSVKVTTEGGPVRHEGSIVGYIGRDHHRGRCFVARKIPDRHYYQVGSGYAMSCAIIGKLQASNVEKVVLYEEPDDRVLVFNLQQYAGGDEVTHAPDDDPQNYVPVADALEQWDDQPSPMLDLR